jgi:predicted porin
MPTNTGSVPSRWGVRGSEDLGNGLNASFTLESGFGLDAGVLGQGGRMFGRQAHVGLSGSWGALTLGRQYTMLFYSMLQSDLLGPNIHGLASFDSYIPNARADGAIGYRGTFNGFTVGATYSRGRDAVNAGPSPAGTNCPQSATDSKACRETSLLLKYDSSNWGMAVATDQILGGAGAFGGMTSSALTDTRTMLNGYYRLNALTVGAGMMQRKNEGSLLTPKSSLGYLQASYKISPAFTLDGGVMNLNFKNSANGATMYAVRGTYHLSKRTAAYASLANLSNDGVSNFSVSGGAPGSGPVAGGAQTGLMVGLRHAF